LGDVNYTTSHRQITQPVAAAPLTVTARGATKVYGQANPGFSATFQGFVLGQDPSVLTGSLGFTTAATASSHVGHYAVTPAGLTSGNYAIAFVAGDLVVTPAPLAVRADDRSKTYGAPLPTFTASYAGFANGDTASGLSTPVAFTTTATAASHVGHFAITPTGASSSDYAITFAAGDLAVT